VDAIAEAIMVAWEWILKLFRVIVVDEALFLDFEF
jgi:hypothetical protein